MSAAAVFVSHVLIIAFKYVFGNSCSFMWTHHRLHSWLMVVFSPGSTIHYTIYSTSTRWKDAVLYHELWSPWCPPGRISGDPSIFLLFPHQWCSTCWKCPPAWTQSEVPMLSAEESLFSRTGNMLIRTKSSRSGSRFGQISTPTVKTMSDTKVPPQPGPN